MFYRAHTHIVAWAGIFIVGTKVIKRVGETTPVKSHTFWEASVALPAELRENGWVVN